ncbi:hypothetical protein ACS78V_08845 [Yersinia enterocolitica]|uniref:hypothetical protein n=1 Tax=Yersinia enterocolitica TaxID=630 RepID=UPI0005E82807|nr:hypothetical protein [Yersinia enterocolitica]EKN3404830.1 hypothetical protein [Yersinia enterocolitica]EKN3563090.1 hypothetical protein [Yersinia enterocolitica]EKN3828411.1 hypothetical protein [Yersinia enterocolitica]EKN3995637.1 hypothetical protein [Yersinia enterocolitica]EKN4826836.1 hypothetical protein [Yersinia enterocolitica]
MTLEKRIEELESEVSSLKEVVTSLVGGDFSIKEGEVFIANAFIQPNIDSNVSAIIENAEANACQYSVRVGVNQVTSDNSKALASTQRLKLRFDVLSPVRDMRVAPDYEDRVEKSKDFSFGMIKTLYSKVHVSGFTDDENDRSTLTIHYVEDYTDKSTFSGVMTRAEEYARNYCQKLGLGAE